MPGVFSGSPYVFGIDPVSWEKIYALAALQQKLAGSGKAHGPNLTLLRHRAESVALTGLLCTGVIPVLSTGWHPFNFIDQLPQHLVT